MTWYAYNVKPLSDGIHLVRPGPWATSERSEAVAFFANGKLIRKYTVGDLVRFPSMMSRSPSHSRWRDQKQLNDTAKTYRIVTKYKEDYLFDVTTGAIISSSSLMPWISTGIGVFFLSIILLFYWLIRKRNDNGAPTPAPPAPMI